MANIHADAVAGENYSSCRMHRSNVAAFNRW